MSELSAPVPPTRGLAVENHTLYGVIALVSSSLELAPMLQGVVELATEATDCHACFIYLVEGETVTIRAASPVFAEAVDAVSFSVHEGLTGWVARQRRSAFIRDGLADDPRSVYVPLLREEHFQSMVAVPILARTGETNGVIVLHTQAPREFTEDALNLLEHIASLVSGAIENAQSYDRERRRVDALTGLAALSEAVSAAAGEAALAETVSSGARALLHASHLSLYRLSPDGGATELIARAPADASAPVARTPAELLGAQDLLSVPLVVGEEHLGLLCAGAPQRRDFTREEREMARAIAHLAAVALKRVELIAGLTKTSLVKDLFEALAAGASELAVTKAAAVGCDLSAPFLLLCARRAGAPDVASADGRAALEQVGVALGTLVPGAVVETGPATVRALLPLDSVTGERTDAVLAGARRIGREHAAVIGVAGVAAGPTAAVHALREALDAATIAAALLPDGGAARYGELGAYRYLVHIDAEHAPRDAIRAAVDTLIAYDRRRRTALLDSLERYLSERQSVSESARQLYVHPNTLRQRLGRIEELTGLSLERDDLLSLELAIKLARLHRRT